MKKVIYTNPVEMQRRELIFIIAAAFYFRSVLQHKIGKMYFIISFDLHKEGQEHEALSKTLKKMEAKRLLTTTWIIKTALSSVSILDMLNSYLDKNDKCVVAEMGSDFATVGFKNDIRPGT